MKKILCVIALFAGLASLAGCRDFLELPNDGRVSLDEIFADPHMSAGYVTTCYSYIPGFYKYSDYGFSYGDCLLASYSDEAEDVYGTTPSDLRNWYTGNVSSAGFPLAKGAWAHYFAGIRTCNVFLNRIRTATSPFSEEQRQEWMAQVYTLRAFYYLQLIQRYGGVPIITEELPEGHDVTADRRASFGEVARQIFADCDQALSRPVEVFGFSKSEENYGKMNPAIAHAIKSRTALYATSPLWHDGTVSYQEAATITKEALDYCLSPQAGFKLFTTMSVSGYYGSPYEYYFLLANDYARTRDNETILNCANLASNQLRVWQMSGLPITGGVSRAGACPSQELVDSYEMTNGVHPFLLDEFGVIRRDVNGDPVLNPDPGNIYDPQRPYDQRDPRLRATVYFDGSMKLQDEVIVTRPGGNCGLSESELKYTRTGYYLRKFNDGRSDVNNNLDGRMRIFRLAELYLNFAEAANRYTEDPGVAVDSGIEGSTPMSALDALNAVRARAGLPGLSGTAATDDSEFEKRCCNERRVELAFEQHRFYDVRRWNILDKTDRGVSGVSISVTGSGSGTTLYAPGAGAAMAMTSLAGHPYYAGISQVFTAAEPFEGVAVACRSYGFADAGVTLSLYEWDAVAEAPKGAALAIKRHGNFTDNTELDLPKQGGGTFPVGTYVWVLSDASGHTGVCYTDGAVSGVRSFRNSEELPATNFKAVCKIRFDRLEYKRFEVSERACWEPKYLRFPIPADEINKLAREGISGWQNPGW